MSQNNILNLKINTKQELYKAFMPFLKNGGIFVASDKKMKMEDEVLLLISLPEADSQRLAVPCRVAWINLLSHGEMKKGYGLQFQEGEQVDQLKSRIDVLLVGFDQEEPTATL